VLNASTSPGEFENDAELTDRILVQELQLTWNATRALWLATERAIAFGLTIIGAASAAGVRDHLTEVKLFLPVALALIYGYGLNMMHEMMGIASYRGRLERIARMRGDLDFAMWESGIAAKAIVFRAPQLAAFAIPALLYLAATVVSLVTAIRYSGSYTRWVNWLVPILDAALLIILLIALVSVMGVGARVQAAIIGDEARIDSDSGEKDHE